jgi:opacity protein-like surface antigen
VPPPSRPSLHCWFALCALTVGAGLFLNGARASAQERIGGGPYARTNTFGVFTGFSNDSSHIVVGLAERRKLLNIGFEYDRRLHLGGLVDWQYSIDVMPVSLEGDPMTRLVVKQTSPTPATYTYSMAPEVTCAPMTEPYVVESAGGSIDSGTETASCGGRRWTMGEAISPLGFEWNFLPRHRLQPLLTAHGGTMFSRREIPILGASSLNFTFAGGAGVEYFLSPARSIRVEYRVHHISNAHTAVLNPGIDNGMLRFSFCFGR